MAGQYQSTHRRCKDNDWIESGDDLYDHCDKTPKVWLMIDLLKDVVSDQMSGWTAIWLTWRQEWLPWKGQWQQNVLTTFGLILWVLCLQYFGAISTGISQLVFAVLCWLKEIKCVDCAIKHSSERRPSPSLGLVKSAECSYIPRILYTRVLYTLGPMYPGSYIPRVLYTLGPIYPGSYIPGSYIPGSYIPRVIYTLGHIYPGSYIPRVLYTLTPIYPGSNIPWLIYSSLGLVKSAECSYVPRVLHSRLGLVKSAECSYIPRVLCAQV
jgi:hypothetical protein